MKSEVAGSRSLLPRKLIRPRLHRAYPRQRLLQELADTLPHSALWISGAPGCGKTALVSSYVDISKRRCLWYKVDSRDTHPATLFHYLRCAAAAVAPRKAKQLPSLTAEYLAARDAYARNFFELFFALLPPNSVLVFDNCQQMDDDTDTGGLLAAGLEQAPASVGVILISRTAPGAAFARLLASERLQVMDGRALMLDVGEAQAMARQQRHRGLSTATVRQLHHQTQGWAAGFILLLKQAGQQGQAHPLGSIRALTDYFAAEVLSGLAPDVLETLLQSAWLPNMPTTLLTEQCANPRAVEHIDALCRKQFFTNRSSGQTVVYEFHPLFRDCLLDKARQSWSASRLTQVRQRAARLLIADQQYEHALELLLELGDWSTVAQLVVDQAAVWLRQGRTQLIEATLAAMPAAEVDARPWLIYWRASCRLALDPGQARTLFMQAEREFAQRRNLTGQLLACAAIVDSHFYEWGDFHPLDRWIKKIERLLQQHPEALKQPEVEVRISAALFVALMYRQPSNPSLGRWSDTIEGLLAQTPDELSRVLLGTHLVMYYSWWSADIARAGTFVDTIQPATDNSQLAPAAHIAWCAVAAINAWTAVDFTHCCEMAERGLQIASDSGVHLWDFMLLAQCSWSALFLGDYSRMEDYLQRMASLLRPNSHLDACHYHFQRFNLAWRQGDAAAMAAQADIALRLARSAGVPWAEGLTLVACARARAAAGEGAAAGKLLRQAESLIDGDAGTTVAYAVLLARAEWACDPETPASGLAELRRLMHLASRKNFVYSNWERDARMAQLCQRALEHGIEPDFVCRLIRLRRLAPDPPPLHLDHWPWRLDINTLNGFQVLIDGQPLRFHGKRQKRPLTLLKAIIALGGAAGGTSPANGAGAAETVLADALWPDADGDTAQQALATALHRLRRLVGADAVLRHDGRLSLNPAQCRVDLWTCERRLEQVETALPRRADAAWQTLQHILAQCGNAFLDGDEDPWVLPPRERIRDRLLRAIVATADTLRHRGDEVAAIACYERGLRIDDLAEACYRGLMRCHLDAGRHAEGLAVYRRCARCLQRGLGVTPSNATETLRRALERC